MRKSRLFAVIMILTLVFSAIGAGALFAQNGQPRNLQVAGGLTVKSVESLPSGAAKMTSIIVKLDDASLASYNGSIASLKATSANATGKKLDVKSPDAAAYLAYLDAKISAFEAAAVTAVPGARVVHRYRATIGGVSMLVPSSQVDAVAKLPGVKAVYRDTVQVVDTDNSPNFIGAPAVWKALGGIDDAGEGVIVGVLDTGIWPEHPSYSDPDPSGEAYASPPGGPFACDFGNTAFNPDDAPFTCNNKLIGAYEFLDTFKLFVGLEAAEFDSARDANGHGTHTSSTAAGNGKVSASILGADFGLVSGIAPRAHVIMYKVCGDIDGLGSCYTTDSAAGVEQAILDGVDVLNFSVGGGGSPYSDIVSLAFLDAYNAGVFVAASAGNSGPAANTTGHREPWVATVAASTQNRAFGSDLTLSADNGDTLTVHGASIVSGISTPTPIVYAGDFGDALCEDATADGTFDGVVVLCDRGVIARVAKSGNVQARGAVGMVLRNLVLQGTATDNHFIPSIHVEYDAGADVFDFMTTHTGVLASWTDGAGEVSPGDVMAAFSSRGGSLQTLGISKPDVTAPGVQILAGHTPLPASISGGAPGELFQVIQGTSMSSPHVAGSGALLRALHPDWTPAQIKSALMTTAKVSVVKEDGVTPADAYDYGSGRIALAAAMDPGLTISASGDDFVAHEDDLWNTNYPSLYVPVMPGQVTVERTVHSELGFGAWWRLSVSAPSDVKVLVPKRLFVGAGADVTFDITVDARNVPEGETRFAGIVLRYGTHILHIPITIVRGQASVTLAKSCDPGTLEIGDTTTCTLTAENTTFDDATVSLSDNLPRQLRLVSGSVVGADESGNGVVFDGTLFAAEPPTPSAITAPWGFGSYLGLGADLGAPPNVTLGDETLVNFAVDPFLYAGESYDSVGMTSNGYLVVGGGTAADIQYLNQSLPDAAVPNNVLAPFWTDINGSAGGSFYAYSLTDGVNFWAVYEWEVAPNYSDGEVNTFQVWIGNESNGFGEDIWFTYGPSLSDGDFGALTIGAENAFGNRGNNYYYNGVGTLPGPFGIDVQVTSIPGAPGETKTITFDATGRASGTWQNCALMTGDTFFGTNIACFSGEVTP